MDLHDFRLSIVMPAYNEERTIEHALEELLAVELPFETEVVVVDDGSRDGTQARLAAFRNRRLRIVRHPRNLGKGAALLTGAEIATGTHILPFDADREYDPQDIPRLAQPIIDGRATVVFGTRLFGANTVYHSYRYKLGNRALTLAANVLFDSAVSDLHTCLKLVPLDVFRALELREQGFGLDTELTAAVLRAGMRPFEVPISYYARSHGEGKKITWRDGVECLRILGKTRVARGAEQIDHPRPRLWATTERPLERPRRPRFADAEHRLVPVDDLLAVEPGV